MSTQRIATPSPYPFSYTDPKVPRVAVHSPLGFNSSYDSGYIQPAAFVPEKSSPTIPAQNVLHPPTANSIYKVTEASVSALSIDPPPYTPTDPYPAKLDSLAPLSPCVRPASAPPLPPRPVSSLYALELPSRPASPSYIPALPPRPLSPLPAPQTYQPPVVESKVKSIPVIRFDPLQFRRQIDPLPTPTLLALHSRLSRAHLRSSIGIYTSLGSAIPSYGATLLGTGLSKRFRDIYQQKMIMVEAELRNRGVGPGDVKKLSKRDWAIALVTVGVLLPIGGDVLVSGIEAPFIEGLAGTAVEEAGQRIGEAISNGPPLE